ncbi:MAG: DUF5333 domain-containing protein [Boseongicola sp.]|nr:DUF5333 domain-containing protein [Boseongicola sp.]
MGIALLIGAASPTLARQPLHENPPVVNAFYSLGLADEVRRNCAAIDGRLLRAWRFLNSIERYARKSGYSDAEIDEFVENKAEKEKLRARIRADLARRGATPGTPEGYCTVGHEEIAKGSVAGRLLRAR